MDDLPTIEEEFAQLEAELQRIAQLPARTPEQQDALIVAMESMRAEWEVKWKARENAPEWRKTVDGAIARAFDDVIRDVKKRGPDGTFRIDPEMVKRHLAPLFQELSDSLRQNLVDKFAKRPPPGAPPVKVDSADVAAILLTVFGPPPKKK